ncbi:MAG: endonuclease/exonuclease/phosphatase family protein [Xanthomonadales bacterium]|nr:endonuclease/exonuclease/phosphatase family protein [Xanthomonadales bacterium]
MRSEGMDSRAAGGTAAWRRVVATAVLSLLLCVLGCTHTTRSTGEAERLPRHPDADLRVLVWNVDREFFHRNEGFQRVLRAVDADVLILDEMPAGVSGEQIVNALPVAAAPWQALYGSGGGANQRASVSARAPLARVDVFDQLPYPREHFDAWMANIPERKRARVRDSLDAGVAAVGGVVTWQGRRVLVVGLDLECCGDSPDSAAEDRRRFEAQAIRNAIDTVAAGSRFDAILVGGDFNAVHGQAPVQILERGARADTTLDHPTPLHRGSDRLDWTWDGRGTPFPSKQIDFLLHSSPLRVLQSQVFDSEDLTPAEQQALQLPAELSRSLSPHRPIVVDFAWR